MFSCNGIWLINFGKDKKENLKSEFYVISNDSLPPRCVDSSNRKAKKMHDHVTKSIAKLFIANAT